MKPWVTVVAALTIVIWGALASAAPVGEPRDELWVDGPLGERVGGSPQTPDATADHRGRQIFVWDDTPTNAGTGIDVFLRIFDRSGNSLVGPVQVNTLDADNQRYARVAVSADGSFLVIWESFEPAEGGIYVPKIRSQKFDSDGNPDGDEQLLSAESTGIQVEALANVAALTGGGFVAVWRAYSSTTFSYEIQGRRVGANGVPVGDQFQVNASMDGIYQQWASVAGLADGGFLAVWAGAQIEARRFEADGTPVTGDFQVNTFESLTGQDQTDVAVHQDGRVLMVWRSGEPPDQENIRGRMYSSTLTALGPDFRINTFVTGAQSEPQVAGYGAAGFFVVWESPGSSGPDAEPDSIEGRIVTGANAFAGSQFLVNRYTANSQEDPGIGGQGGQVATVWMGRENEAVLGQVIMGQYWHVCGIFCDSFE
ncbi:MAG: hypothetical protein R3233_04370 [Xanthomonadales bacterium]|nr:hypothetical protein [Xanthomonadales bacterium]